MGRPNQGSQVLGASPLGGHILLQYDVFHEISRPRALIAGSSALAHHSGVMFGSEKEVSVKGTVKEFNFVNPHVTTLISVADDKGATTDWSIEAASVRGMALAGWRRSTLKPGGSVTIVGHPLKDGRPGAQLDFFAGKASFC